MRVTAPIMSRDGRAGNDGFPEAVLDIRATELGRNPSFRVVWTKVDSRSLPAPVRAAQPPTNSIRTDAALCHWQSHRTGCVEKRNFKWDRPPRADKPKPV